jgi:DNA-binding transcriptional MerR regulator
MAERDHHSIGEVLAMVQQDFPDVTISKIRFLESQGLLDPERTTSGYRKFYDGDVERLRWILHQQRDHYLPLKVIKDRILNGFADNADNADNADKADNADARQEDPVPVAESQSTPERSSADPPPGPAPEPAPAASNPLDEGMSTVSMTADELAAATGLSADEVDDLHRFGLIESRAIGAADLYDGEALQVARLAADFVGRGIEIRHLKMYRISADREAGFYEQVVSPLAGHRDPATRSRARSEVRELVRLGEELKASLLRRSLREQLGGP